MQERGISDDEVDDALSSGTMYRDEDTGGTIYYDNGLAVVTQGNTLVTCYIGQVKGRWTPL
jgi:2',3'-cyclic-nucleotide 2'-phosphodiesterase (5'-nucleotidase family)